MKSSGLQGEAGEGAGPEGELEIEEGEGQQKLGGILEGEEGRS